MTELTSTIIYSDIAFSRNGRVLNEESIIQAVLNFLNTRPGERFFNSEFGSNFDSTMFKFIDEFEFTVSKAILRSALLRADSRVRDVILTFKGKPDDNSVEVEFGIVTEFGTILRNITISE